MKSNDSKKFNNRNDIFKVQQDGMTIKEKSQKFFNLIEGYDKIKENFYRALLSDKQINILLIGSDSGIKTKFILALREQCHDVFYFEISASSSLFTLNEKLFNNRLAKLIIIKNLDKMKKNDLNTLSSFFDNGIIIFNHLKERTEFKMENIKVFATVEKINKLSPQLISRFQEYTFVC